ncbi:MAG: SDR family NAD(P)-dependent oxidoreductase [Pirellulaceae bacterium]|nr:SDR family NAD(P)-dependent oxidoreductase [Pirellulaceae bacterium]
MSPWNEKVVAITGGSAGLGLAIARAFHQRGAVVVLIARDPSKLATAEAALGNERVLSVTADVTDQESVKNAFAQILQQTGRLDVLVNNVGKSDRIELLDTSLANYREFMEINFLSAVSCTYAALEALTKSSGHVVNIGSLSSKTAWPLLAPYTTSKFALAAFTHHLRLEGPPEVHSLLVCPGPIKRNDAGERYDKQASKRGLSAAARQPGAGARVRAMDSAQLAEKIISSCEKRKPEWMPFKYRLVLMLNALSPNFGDWFLKKKMKKSK